MFKLKYLFFVGLIMFISGCGTVTPDYVKQLHQEKVPDITLELNTGGHTAGVIDSAVSKDGDEIVTASQDKTVRVWDVKTGEEKRKILGEIGNSVLGTISAIALSNDDKYLAVAGYFPTQAGYIRIYDYKSGKILQVLKQNKGLVILDLSFSKDAKYLVSSNQSGMSYIWNVANNFALYDTLKTKYPQYAVKIIKKDKKYFVVATGSDATLILYDLQSNSIIKSVSTAKGANFMYLSTTEANGGNIALTNYITQPNYYYKRIMIFDYTLKHIKTIRSTSDRDGVSYIPSASKYSKDGKRLVVGSYFGQKKDDFYALIYPVTIYRVDQNYKEEVRFTKHTNVISSVNFINSTTAVSIGGNNNEIYIWNVKNGKVKKRIQGDGNSVYRVAIKGNEIAWGNVPISQETGKITKLEHSFNLQNYQFSKKTKQFKVLSTYNQQYHLSSYSSQKRNTLSYERLLEITENGEWKRYIKRDASIGYVHTTYGWYKDYIVSGGYNGSLNIYDLDGDFIATLVGHQGVIFSIDIDGDRLISGSTDQTMKIWDLSKVGKEKIIKPLVTIFVGDDKSWTMWTEEGYFTQSSNSAKNIYFHLNNGPFKEATAIGIDKLYDHFFRPDLVKLKLQGEDISKYTHGLTYKDVLKDPPPSVKIAQVKKSAINTKERTVTLDFSVRENNNGGVGVIRIYQEGKLVKTIGKGELKRQVANADIKEEDAKIDKLSKRKQAEFLALSNLNSKAVKGEIALSDSIGTVDTENISNKSGAYSVTLPIKAGSNDISIEAYNKTNTVASYREQILVKAKMKKRVPKIYAIVAGVNQFEHKNVQNLKYSENDAKTMAREIKNATEYKTEVTLLLGKKVTKENILAAIKKIEKKAHLEDKILFYISTHGKAAKGNLYLVPQNNKNIKMWINFADIFQEIQSVSALNQIFIIDACESGKASDTLGAVYDAKASVLAKQSGAHLLMATTSGTYAFENEKAKHGAFTNNILKALRSRSTDKNHNKKISIIELSTTLKEPKYTEDHQFPVIRNIGADTYIKKVKR